MNRLPIGGSPDPRSAVRAPWRLVLWFAAADALLRLATLALGTPPLLRDQLGYWRLAEEIGAGSWAWTQSLEVFRTPGYPFFLALHQLAFSSRALFLAAVSQHLLGLATGVLAVWIVWRLTRSRAAVTFAYFLLIVPPTRAVYANLMLSEVLFGFLVVLYAAILVAWSERPGRWPLGLAAGLDVGLATLVRPLAVPLAGIALAVPLATFLGRRRSPVAVARIAAGCFAVLLGTMAVAAPWALRNRWLFGEPFLAKALGRNMWLSCFEPSGAGLEPPTSGAGAEVARLAAAQAPPIDLADTWSVSTLLGRNGMSERVLDDRMLEVCREAIREQPGRFGRSVARRFGVYWLTTGKNLLERAASWDGCGEPVAGQRGWCWSTLREVRRAALVRLGDAGPWLMLALSLAAFAGAALLCLRRPAIGVALLGTLLYFGLVTAVTASPLHRYRVIVDPLLLACAASLLGARSRPSGAWTE